jgi:hypothetical protein
MFKSHIVQPTYTHGHKTSRHWTDNIYKTQVSSSTFHTQFPVFFRTTCFSPMWPSSGSSTCLKSLQSVIMRTNANFPVAAGQCRSTRLLVKAPFINATRKRKESIINYVKYKLTFYLIKAEQRIANLVFYYYLNSRETSIHLLLKTRRVSSFENARNQFNSHVKRNVHSHAPLSISRRHVRKTSFPVDSLKSSTTGIKLSL